MSEGHSTNCAFPGCDRPAKRKELCKSHALQRYRGNPLTPLFAKSRPAGTPPRIRYVEVPCLNPNLKGPCHVFQGSRSAGYGQVWDGTKLVWLHRYVWEKTHGEIPDGLVIDHQCRNRACCNIDHLRLVTAQVNSTENSTSPAAINLTKTHCPRGHAYNEANTRQRKTNGRNGRVCRACHRIEEAERKKRKENA